MQNTYKRIFQSSVSQDVLREFLHWNPCITVRRTNQGDAWAVEGVLRFKPHIDNLVSVYGTD